jgi:hypothetical protein
MKAMREPEFGYAMSQATSSLGDDRWPLFSPLSRVEVLRELKWSSKPRTRIHDYRPTKEDGFTFHAIDAIIRGRAHGCSASEIGMAQNGESGRNRDERKVI